MTAKSISVWCAGVLVVGGMFWMGQQPSWAAEQLMAASPAAPVISSMAPAYYALPPPAQVRSPAAPTVAPAPAPSNAAASTAKPSLERVPPPEAVPTPEAPRRQPQCCEGEECDDACGPICSPPGKYWLRTDYLAWWTNGTKLPPLVTTSPTGTPVAQAGVLGAPGTTVFFGDATVGTDMRSGFRTTLGMWLDCCHKWDVEFDYLSLGERPNDFNMFSTGFPILARPFFNVRNQRPSERIGRLSGHGSGNRRAPTPALLQGAGVTVQPQSLLVRLVLRECCDAVWFLRSGSCSGDMRLLLRAGALLLPHRSVGRFPLL